MGRQTLAARAKSTRLIDAAAPRRRARFPSGVKTGAIHVFPFFRGRRARNPGRDADQRPTIVRARAQSLSRFSGRFERETGPSLDQCSSQSPAPPARFGSVSKRYGDRGIRTAPSVELGHVARRPDWRDRQRPSPPESSAAGQSSAAEPPVLTQRPAGVQPPDLPVKSARGAEVLSVSESREDYPPAHQPSPAASPRQEEETPLSAGRAAAISPAGTSAGASAGLSAGDSALPQSASAPESAPSALETPVEMAGQNIQPLPVPPPVDWASPAEAAARKWLLWSAASVAGLVVLVGALSLLSAARPPGTWRARRAAGSRTCGTPP